MLASQKTPKRRPKVKVANARQVLLVVEALEVEAVGLAVAVLEVQPLRGPPTSLRTQCH